MFPFRRFFLLQLACLGLLGCLSGASLSVVLISLMEMGMGLETLNGSDLN